jgi:hypothetical protein
MNRAELAADSTLMFWCPGCDEAHGVPVGEAQTPRRWKWNGSLEKPTLEPSLIVRSGHFAPGHTGDCWCTFNAKNPDTPSKFVCRQCHSLIRDGQIQFLTDCSHALAGKTVDLPAWGTQ